MKSKILALFFAAASAASAQVLMLDFGPTAATGGDLTNSPYHTANTGFSGTTWNTVGTADVTSGLLFSNATAAGVTVNLGVTTTNTVNLTSQPSTSSTLGTATNTGVYAGSSVGKDGIFSGAASSTNTVGLQIGGLSAGTYDIYITARNTNTGQQPSNGYSQTALAGKSAGAGDFDFTGYTASTLSYPSNSNTSLYTTAWVQGENYVKLSITLSSGEFLNIAVDGAAIDTNGDTRGFLNSVQIVNTSAIPEPSAFAALAGLGVLGLAVLRRRRTPR